MLLNKNLTHAPSPHSGFRYSAVIAFACIGILFGLSIYNPPETYRVFHPFLQRTEGATFRGLSLATMLYLSFHYLIITIFGYSLSRGFLASLSGVSFLLKFVSSFFIGFTCSLGIIRLVSLFVGYAGIYWPTISVIIFLSLLGLTVYQKPDWRKVWDMSSYVNGSAIFLFIFQFFILAAFIFFVLIFQIKQDIGDFTWVGHGPGQYAYLLDLWGQGQYGHFPVIAQHYDELIFHYFLTALLKPVFSPIIPWWITLGLVKVSMLVFVFACLKKFGISTYLSIIFCLYMVLGTTSLMPTRYYILFDAGNPLFFTSHSGRLVGIGLIILIIIDNLFNTQSKSYLSILFFILLGVGITSTSISNVVWIGIIFGLSILYSLYYRHKPMPGTL